MPHTDDARQSPPSLESVFLFSVVPFILVVFCGHLLIGLSLPKCAAIYAVYAVLHLSATIYYNECIVVRQ